MTDNASANRQGMKEDNLVGMRESNLALGSRIAPESQEHGEEMARSESSSAVWRRNKSESGSNRSSCCCDATYPKFQLFTQDTTLHGIKYTTDTNISMYRRVLWFILMLAMITSFVLTLKDSAIRYASNPLNTVVSYDELETMPFPAVTICNYNSFRKSVVEDTEVAQYLKILYGDLATLPKSNSSQAGEFDPPPAISLDKSEFMLQSAHQIEDMLKECTWASDVYCTVDNFTKILTDFGVCYTFNGDAENQLSVRTRGQPFGLFMSLDIQQWEYYYGPNRGAGLKILVHHQRDTPLVGELGMALSPGKDSTIALRFAKSIMLDCHEEKLEYFAEYSTANCEMEKRAKAVAHDCNCRLPYMPGNATVCSTYRETMCVRRALRRHEYKCAVPCVNAMYTATVSYAAFPGPHVVQRLTEIYNQTESEMRENIILLSIYIEDLTVLVTKQEEAYPIDNFLGDLGGQMGLCMGASILTVLEFAEFFMMLLVRHQWKR